MVELGQLERQHEEFKKRNTRVVVISIENQEEARKTQADFPHLVVLADSKGQLSETLQVIHHQSSPEGGDTSAPTTILVDGAGKVRWTYRPDRFFTRLPPTELLAAIDEHMKN